MHRPHAQPIESLCPHLRSPQEQIRTLTEKKYEIQAEEEKSKMSPEEQRESLMAKIKRDNQEVESVTQQVMRPARGLCVIRPARRTKGMGY